MTRAIVKTVWRSLIYYRLQALYQFAVIMLLAAVITGSLLTGSSVRESLRSTNIDRIGNSGLVFSSGTRYFDWSLGQRLIEISGTPVVSITELKGWSRNFTSGETALNCQVMAVDNDFFTFHNPSSTVTVERGKAIINGMLASRLNLNPGDEIMIRFNTISEIPADSPFSAEDNSFETLVLVVSSILEEESPANFSLGVNQIKPENIFIHRDDLGSFFGGTVKANRLLVANNPGLHEDQAAEYLTQVLLPGDIGLSINSSEEAGQYELLSDRIFIDSSLVDIITGRVNGARPVLTYLANSITTNGRATPYSFVSALPGDLYNGIPAGSGILINRWLADDLGAEAGDSIYLTYFISAPMNKLEERGHAFVIDRIVEMDGIYGDPDLMPRFPGISGRESCSRWDAGVPVKMDDIREKDEDYWYQYNGTPKAFINYNIGKEIWGSNFGTATAIRFPSNLEKEDILDRLKANIDPFVNGFRIIDARSTAIQAASNSVDFSTLFLSLGFFIIVSALLLLSMVVSTFFESRSGHISTMRAIGFRRRLIGRILFLETATTAITGSLAGVAAGYLFNVAVIDALNSVWRGAVQTDTLAPSFDPAGMITGFAVTLAVTLSVLFYKTRRLLKQKRIKEEVRIIKLPGRDYLYPSIAFLLAILSITGGLVKPGYATSLFFSGGTLLLVAFLFLVFAVIAKKGREKGLLAGKHSSHSWLFYGRYPSRAITPVLFIAAGLFVVITTGANRKNFDTGLLTRESGTGGYLLWGETATPLAYDMNSMEGRDKYGFEGTALTEAYFVQGLVASGDDASCLNLNQVNTPPLLGIDAATFTKEGAFSFSTRLKEVNVDNPWEMLELSPGDNTIYGIIDQTVLQWGLKKKVGDTLTMSTESGQPLHIIIGGGLSSSIFQGYIIIGSESFSRYLPSIAGSNIFLVDGQPGDAAGYMETLKEILSPYGTEVDFTWDRLAGFNQVSNTYLTVFMTLGGFGMLIGVLGLAFILLRNYNLRKKEFALLMSTGYTPRKIRGLVLHEHLAILIAGITAGTIPAVIATLPSITSGTDIPLVMLSIMIAAIFFAGWIALLISSRSMLKGNLISNIRSN